MKIEIAGLTAIVRMEQRMNRIVVSTCSTMKLLSVCAPKGAENKSVVRARMNIMADFSGETTTYIMKVIITMLISGITSTRDDDIAKAAFDSFILSKVQSKQWMTMVEVIQGTRSEASAKAARYVKSQSLKGTRIIVPGQDSDSGWRSGDCCMSSRFFY